MAAFDEQIQVRFLDPRLGFGLMRLCAPPGHSAMRQLHEEPRVLPTPDNPSWRNRGCGAADWARFRPRNRQEQWAAREVGRGDVAIMTFLVGGVHRTMEGPVIVGGGPPADLNELRRRLLPRIKETPIPEDPLGEWRVAVRSVRATRESCVGCHADTGKQAPSPPRIKGLKLNDPLGYLVYLYRQRP